MSEYTPDHWVLLKIDSGKEPPFYKVLAGWDESYLYGTSWRLNSGVESVEETPTHFIFHGSSGSRYACRKTGYNLHRSIAYIYNELKTRYGSRIDLMPEDTDWLTLVEEPPCQKESGAAA